MDKELQEFMANVQNKEPIGEFEDTEEDTSPDSPPENNTEEEEVDSSSTEEEEGSQVEEEPDEEPQPEEDVEEEGDEPDSDKDLPPFHEHPRWQEIYGGFQELKEENSELKEKLNEVLPQLSETPKQEPEEAPEWFKDIFGEDEDTWSKYREYNQKERQQLKREVMQEIQKEQQKAQEQQSKYDEWVKSEVSRLKSEHGDFDKNRLMKVALDYKPTDDEGNIDLDKAYDIMTKMQSSKEKPKKKKESTTKKKKDIAAKTMDDTKGEGDKKDFMTPDDLRGKTTHDLLHE